jgi:hypothetical protein
MIYGAAPFHAAQRPALRVRDRHQRNAAELPEQVGQLRHVEASVQRGQVSEVAAFRRREVEVIDVKVDDVEFVGHITDPVDHHHMRQKLVVDGMEPERARPGRNQPRFGHGISAREQRDVVALAHQLIGEIGDDSFGSAIQSGRNAFVEGRDLRDSHVDSSLRGPRGQGPCGRKCTSGGLSHTI